jgi:ribonuclease HII
LFLFIENLFSFIDQNHDKLLLIIADTKQRLIKMTRRNLLQLCLKGGRLEAGCDEAGRGCLAGPVVAAAVILPANFENDLLNDSKELTEKERNLLRPIIETQALAWAIGVVSHTEIDEINILNASFLAMHRAISQLKLIPEHLLIDGNRFNPYPHIQHTCIIKGDGKFMPIAAASVLAKTFRDDLMKSLHGQFPQYCWNNNKGYPTKAHRQAIRETGPSPYHRMTFHLLKEQLELDFG